MTEFRMQEGGRTTVVPPSAPMPKVVAAGAAGALTVLLVWVVGFWGVQVPEEVSAAVTALLATLAAYVKR